MFLWRTPIQPNYDEDQKKSIKMIKNLQRLQWKCGYSKKTIVKNWKLINENDGICLLLFWSDTALLKYKKVLTTIFMIWKTFWAGIYLSSNFCSLNRRNRDVLIIIFLLHFWWLRKTFYKMIPVIYFFEFLFELEKWRSTYFTCLNNFR